MKIKKRNLIAFGLMMAFSSLSFAMRSGTLIYNLSSQITLTVTIEERENRDYILFYLNDSRPNGVKNWRFDFLGIGNSNMVQKIKFPKPDYHSENLDPVIEFEENGDLARNLKRGGNFIYDMVSWNHYSGGWSQDTTIYPVKKIIREQNLARHSLREIPGIENSTRHIAVREVDRSGEPIISIAYVQKDGSYVYQYLLGDTDGHYELKGPYMDLYSMPDKWTVEKYDKPRLLLGGSLLLESPFSGMGSRLYLESLVRGEGKFPVFTYSLNTLGTKNYIADLDKTVSKPTKWTIVDNEGNKEVVEMKPDEFRRSVNFPALSEKALEERAKTAADDVMERLKAISSVPAPSDGADGSKKPYDDLMARLGVKMRICRQAQRR